MSLCVNLYICTLAIPEEKSCEILLMVQKLDGFAD